MHQTEFLTSIRIRRVKIPSEKDEQNNDHGKSSDTQCPHDRHSTFCWTDDRIEHNPYENAHDEAANMRCTVIFVRGRRDPLYKTHRNYPHME